MNLYIPKRGVENLLFILEQFVNTHEDSEASTEDVKLARNLIPKIRSKA
jgi:hypothetical protein